MKTELTFRLPAVHYRSDVSDQLLAEFAAFIGQITAQKYIFLSKTENIVIEEMPIFQQQLPRDVHLMYFKLESADRFIEVKNRSRFRGFGESSDRSLNEVVIQAPNPVLVRGLHTRIASILEPQRFVLRTLVYRYPLVWYWLTLVLLWFGEYRVLRVLRPAVGLNDPLSALGAILILAIGLGTALVYANFIVPFFAYWFPYFEIEGNLSRHRLSFQKAAGAIMLSLFAAGILNIFFLLKG